MDYASHGIWSYIFFHKIQKPIYAILFGVLPDSASWLIYLIYRLVTTRGFGRPILDEIPNWVFILYNISHSIFVAFFVILLLSIILKKVPVYTFAWPIAIVMDLFTHRRDFLPTPFLWPISEWKFDGFSWGNRTFLVVNYVLMATCLIIIYVRRKRRMRVPKI